VDITDVKFAQWTTTKLTKRQREALRISLQTLGQIQALVVREGSGWLYECLDGSQRLELLEMLGAVKVDVLDLGKVDDAKAREIHLALNLNRGKPNAGPLADALEAVVHSRSTPDERAFKEVVLLELLPLSSKSIDKTVAKLRSKGTTRQVVHNPKAPHGWVDFKFSVDPAAAKVCDQALTRVEKSTGCQRHVAFERVCADFLQGPNPGRQP
jgi:ParB-like chromosome segregation protein Spo0J